MYILLRFRYESTPFRPTSCCLGTEVETSGCISNFYRFLGRKQLKIGMFFGSVDGIVPMWQTIREREVLKCYIYVYIHMYNV